MLENTRVILYAENDLNDVILTGIALERAQLPVRMVSVRDGLEAQAYLQGLGAYADRESFPWPDLVLLDLKMPRQSGFELAAWIRAHWDWEYLPVVVLTSSEQPEDRKTVLKVGVNGYFIKPIGLEELERLLHEIAGRWLALPVAKA